MKAQMIRDAVWSPPAGESQRDDPSLRALGQPVRRRARARAEVRERQSRPVATRPLRRGRWRTLKPLCGPSDRPPILSYQQDKPSASFRRERGISVSHGDLRFNDASVVTHILAGGLRLPQEFTTSRGTTASAQDSELALGRAEMAPLLRRDRARSRDRRGSPAVSANGCGLDTKKAAAAPRATAAFCTRVYRAKYPR